MAKAPKKFTPPNLANATPSFITDELGLAREHKSYWEKAEKFYKEALKARIPDTQTVVEGDEFVCTIESVTQGRTDGDQVERDYAKMEMTVPKKNITFDQMRTVRKERKGGGGSNGK